MSSHHFYHLDFLHLHYAPLGHFLQALTRQPSIRFIGKFPFSHSSPARPTDGARGGKLGSDKEISPERANVPRLPFEIVGKTETLVRT